MKAPLQSAQEADFLAAGTAEVITEVRREEALLRRAPCRAPNAALEFAEKRVGQAAKAG